jgi:hypothetical protein
MFPVELGALLVLVGILYMARTAIRRASLSGPGFLPAGSRHSGAAPEQRANLRARNERAGYSPYGNRCNSVGVGGQFLASATGCICKQ